MSEDTAPKHDPLMKAVGARVRALREEAGAGQQDFAQSAGMTKFYYNRVEQGRQNVSLRTLARIAVALDISMSAILEGIEPGPVDDAPRPWTRKPKEIVG